MGRERWYIILKTSVNKLEVICFQKKFGSNGFDCISCSQQCTFYFAFSTLFNGYSLFCSISTWNITAFFPYIHLGYLLFWWWLLPFLVSFLRLFRSFSCLNAQDNVVCQVSIKEQQAHANIVTAKERKRNIMSYELYNNFLFVLLNEHMDDK